MTELLHFRIGEEAAAQALVKHFHYSRRWPSNVQVVGTWHEAGGLFGDRGNPVAACVFAIPPTRWAEPVLELARLVRRDDRPVPLTGLIGKTVDWCRKQGADVIVSFADWTQHHHGGIYQAASWNYAGCRDRACDGILLDGVFWPGRSCNSKWSTRSPDRLREIMPGRQIEPHYDEGKHLYWRALSRAGKKQAARLGLASLPYPKPEKAP